MITYEFIANVTKIFLSTSCVSEKKAIKIPLNFIYILTAGIQNKVTVFIIFNKENSFYILDHCRNREQSRSARIGLSVLHL